MVGSGPIGGGSLASPPLVLLLVLALGGSGASGAGNQTDPLPDAVGICGAAVLELHVAFPLFAAVSSALVAEIPAPLGVGSIRLAGGREAKGFLCETVAARDAVDITHYGGWRLLSCTSRCSGACRTSRSSRRSLIRDRR